MNLFNNIKNLILKLFKNKKIKNLGSLNFLEVGDIIWAKRYKTEKERLKIPEGHREGPYVIVYSSRKTIYAVPCTSQKRKLWNQLYTELDKYDYDLDKNTFVRSDILEPLEPHQYVSKISTLYEEDLNTILERLVIAKNNHCLKNDYKLELDVPLRKGNIVSINDTLYYIYDIDDAYYHLFNIKKSKKSDGSINIYGITYTFNFNSTSKIKISNKHIMKLLNLAGNTQIKSIDFKYKKYLKNKKLENTIRRGSIVSKNDEIYFIFGEYKYNWLAIRLSKTPEINYLKIGLSGTRYYSDYQETIVKNSNLSLITQTTEEEIGRIKHLRKVNRPKIKKSSITNTQDSNNKLDKMIKEALGFK